MTADLDTDLLVVGAGINGAGIARDAAMRGLRVLLVDKDDVGGGTTAASTRLIHGGLRYLERLEVPLVRESLRERATLLRIAPHLVRPMPFLIPIYRTSARGRIVVKTGLLTYDALALGAGIDHHEMLSRAEALEAEPGLERAGLRGAAAYHDAQVEYAERLAVENALSARDFGATVLTHTRVERLLSDDGTVVGAELTGHDGQRLSARARVTVNVAGPWVDEVLRGALSVKGPPLIGGTKGSHIVVGPFATAPRRALYVEARADHRPYFIVPWNDLYLIGTTDNRYEGDLDAVRADPDEIDYLVEETNRVLPAAHLEAGSVLYSYAGVRPLPYHPRGEEAAVTRRHVVHRHRRVNGLLSVTGGKLTTYRRLSEQVVEAVYHYLGQRLPHGSTADEPLPGAAALAGSSAIAGIDTDVAARLRRIYGTRAAAVAALAAKEPALAAKLLPDGDRIAAEVAFAFRAEMAVTLTDALLRRTMIGLGPDLGRRLLGPAADVAAAETGWDAARRQREIDDYRATLARLY